MDNSCAFSANGNLRGDSFTFTSDDDLWIYINSSLVTDIGGVRAAANETVIGAQLVSRLGLAEDALYDLNVFFEIVDGG